MKELHGYKSRTAFMIGNGIEPSASAASSLHRWLKSGKDPEKWANYYNNKEHSKATPISIFIINGKEISGFKSALMELGFDRDELEKIAISARIWMKKNPEKTIFDFAEHRRQKDMARAEYQILRQQGYASDIVVNYYIWRKRHSDTKDNSAENYIITVKNRTSKSSIKQSLAEYGLSRHYRLCENWLKENPGKAVKDFANWYHMSRIITINGIEFTSISEALIYCGMKEHYHACQKYIERNYRDDWNTGFNNWHAKHI